MSKESIKEFFEELERNDDLKNKFDSIMREYIKPASSRIIELANRAGFNCSLADFEEALKEYDEVSDDEMKKVAGGRRRGYPPGMKPSDFNRFFY